MATWWAISTVLETLILLKVWTNDIASEVRTQGKQSRDVMISLCPTQQEAISEKGPMQPARMWTNYG